MGLIPDDHKMHIKEKLQQNMKDPVRIIVFTQEMECQFCKEARQFAEEAASLVPDKIKAEIYDLVKDTEKAKEYDVDKVPAMVIVGTKDYGIRYYSVKNKSCARTYSPTETQSFGIYSRTRERSRLRQS